MIFSISLLVIVSSSLYDPGLELLSTITHLFARKFAVSISLLLYAKAHRDPRAIRILAIIIFFNIVVFYKLTSIART